MTLTSCGVDRTDSSQVAVRVNDDEISLHQLRYVLDRSPRLAADRSEGRLLALDSLLNQELAAQAARKEGLDQEPAYVQGLEVARRELLARLYQERVAAHVRGPSTDEVDRYYDSHPALFSERRLYTLQEVVVKVGPEDGLKVRQIVEASGSAADLVSALEREGMRSRSVMLVKAPEEMPMRLLEHVAQLEEGQSMLVSEGADAQIWTLVQAQQAGVSRQQARRAIEGYLLAARRRDELARHMQALREAAHISYGNGLKAPSSRETGYVAPSGGDGQRSP